MRVLCVFGEHAYGDPARGQSYEFVNVLPAFERLGHEVRLFESHDRRAYRDFAELNTDFVRTLNAFRPHLVFFVFMSYEIWTETLDLVRSACPAMLVDWGTDDSWKYDQCSRFLVPHLDLHVTTDHRAFETARREGRENLLLSQWAASSATLAEPLPSAACRYDVTFVGAAYGNRPEWIDRLRKRGIEVNCFGHGWEGGVLPASEVRRVYRESRVSLNFADSGLLLRGGKLGRSRQIKARTFEVPGAGGFLLTQSAEQLERYFKLGDEIAVFSGPRELEQRVRYYLEHAHERDRVALAGHARVCAEHTYEARLLEICAAAERATSAAGRRDDWRIDLDRLEPYLQRHRIGMGLRAARGALTGLGRLLFGAERGPRAARRLVLELSWRLAGARTYSAAGLPGRMFYRES